MSAHDRVLDELDKRGRVRPQAGYHMAQCPAHEDNTASLSVKRGTDGRVLLHCHAGCTTQAVADALGLTLADLFDPKDEPVGKPSKVAEYRYTDEHGNLLFIKERYVPKTFRIRRANGEYGLGDTPRVLYRLPEVLAAREAGRTIWIVEGEKDADRLAALGEAATCNFDGAGPVGQRTKWRGEYNQWLAGAAQVIVIRDRDTPGRAHAAAVVASIDGAVRRLDIREAAQGSDLSDHLDAGHHLDDLLPVDPAAEDQSPPTDDPEPPDRRRTLVARFVSGATFVLDSPEGILSVWGEEEQVLWARGESLLLVGPPGVGKTTLGGQLLRARLGADKDLLGWPVAPTVSRVLYLAMDRPPQIARSMRRVFREEDRDLLAERLLVWRGPPETDMARDTGLLLEMAEAADADTVFIDSIKDAAIKLSDDEVGAGLNQAVQRALVGGIEVIGLHHQTKRSGSGTGKPDTLADVYGSAWITAGSGSVILLWGDPGASVVELRHLKQPMEDVGPLKLLHDHDTGRTSVFEEVDLLAVIRENASHGLTARAAACRLFGTSEPTDNDVERARRRLKSLAKKGLAAARSIAAGGPGKPELRYFPITLRVVPGEGP